MRRCPGGAACWSLRAGLPAQHAAPSARRPGALRARSRAFGQPTSRRAVSRRSAAALPARRPSASPMRRERESFCAVRHARPGEFRALPGPGLLRSPPTPQVAVGAREVEACRALPSEAEGSGGWVAVGSAPTCASASRLRLLVFWSAQGRFRDLQRGQFAFDFLAVEWKNSAVDGQNRRRF
jgi:hypothetical protein